MRCYAALPLCLGLLAITAIAADEKAARAGGHPAAAPKAPVAKAPKVKPAAGNAGIGPEEIQRLLAMKPEDRDKLLRNLPPKRRENIQKRLNDLAKMPAASRRRLLTRAEMLSSLPLPMRQQVRRSVQQYDELPPERRIAIGRELRSMAPMPDEERLEHMNSEEFRNRYSVNEQQMIHNLSKITPVP